MMPAIMFMFAPPRGIFGVFPLFFLICVDCGLAASGRSQEFFRVGWTVRGAAANCPADTVNGLGLVAILLLMYNDVTFVINRVPLRRIPVASLKDLIKRRVMKSRR